MSKVLNLLCAGAAQGLVKTLQAGFERDTGAVVSGRFGAVGAMREALESGAPCDVMILTAALVDALCASGALLGRADTGPRGGTGKGAAADLGAVHTGVAVRAGEPLPDVSTPERLKAALLAATVIYFPDPLRATAGIHFASVMRQLGIHESLRPRFSTFPSGATAMRELAAGTAPHRLGCTQVSEILYTPGLQLAGPLPRPFELATVYTAAVCARAEQPLLAERLVALLTGPHTITLRTRAGFEIH